MSEHDEQVITFTWTAEDGTSHEVEPVYDIDSWTGREIRAVERITGGTLGGTGHYGTASLIMAVSIARAVPGVSLQRLADDLTLGQLRAINRQLDERRAALAPVEAEAVAEVDDDLLSPTSAGSDEA